MTQMYSKRNITFVTSLGFEMMSEAEPTEAALSFMSLLACMFNDPLPLDVTAALNEMFNLNDDGAEARQLFGGGGLNFSPRPIGYLDTN